MQNDNAKIETILTPPTTSMYTSELYLVVGIFERALGTLNHFASLFCLILYEPLGVSHCLTEVDDSFCLIKLKLLKLICLKNVICSFFAMHERLSVKYFSRTNADLLTRCSTDNLLSALSCWKAKKNFSGLLVGVVKITALYSV